MKLAIAQTEIYFENQTKNLIIAADWIAQAAHQNADWIIFPETSFTGFSMHTDITIPLADMAIQAMQKLAKKYHIAIGFGVMKKADCISHRQCANHYLVVDSSGNILTDFTKLHPFSSTGEDKITQSGNNIVTGTLSGIPFSTLICYDLRFPEVFRIAAQRASLILVPANWLAKRHAHFSILLRARAIEQQVYILGVNCTGTQEGNHFLGGSCFWNPEGKALLQCDDKPQLQIVEWVDDVAAYRSSFSCFYDARIADYANWLAGIGSKKTALREDIPKNS